MHDTMSFCVGAGHGEMQHGFWFKLPNLGIKLAMPNAKVDATFGD